MKAIASLLIFCASLCAQDVKTSPPSPPALAKPVVVDHEHWERYFQLEAQRAFASLGEVSFVASGDRAGALRQQAQIEDLGKLIDSAMAQLRMDCGEKAPGLDKNGRGGCIDVPAVPAAAPPAPKAEAPKSK